LPVYTLASSSEGPTTTELTQEVSLEFEGKSITFIDTPGFSFLPSEEESALQNIRAKDILLRSKGRIDRLKDPSPPSESIAPDVLRNSFLFASIRVRFSFTYRDQSE